MCLCLRARAATFQSPTTKCTGFALSSVYNVFVYLCMFLDYFLCVRMFVGVSVENIFTRGVFVFISR